LPDLFDRYFVVHWDITPDYTTSPQLPVNRLDVWPNREAITVDYSEGVVIEVPQHDGSAMKLRKLTSEYDPTDKVGAMTAIARAAEKGRC
jgi:2-oxoglutarate/2-oxoacid ferredoxin oxidoreductase subunit beta